MEDVHVHCASIKSKPFLLPVDALDDFTKTSQKLKAPEDVVPKCTELIKILQEGF